MGVLLEVTRDTCETTSTMKGQHKEPIDITSDKQILCMDAQDLYGSEEAIDDRASYNSLRSGIKKCQNAACL